MNETITTMPLLPLRGLVLYPDMILHFDLGREPSIHAAEYAMGNNVPVFLVAQRDIKDENPDMEALYTIGTVAHVRQILRLPGNDVRILVAVVPHSDNSAILYQHILCFQFAGKDVHHVTVLNQCSHMQSPYRSALTLFENMDAAIVI